MSTPLLYKIPLDSDGKPEPGKVSEMFLEFAGPLFDLNPAGPPDIDTMRTLMMLAELCWNLPVFERTESRLVEVYKRQFDQVLASAPGPVADTLRKLIEDRRERFGEIPFLITCRVEGTSPTNARVVAEARLPGSTSAGNWGSR